MADHEGAGELLDMILAIPSPPPHGGTNGDGGVGDSAAENNVGTPPEALSDASSSEVALCADGLVAPFLDGFVRGEAKEGLASWEVSAEEEWALHTYTYPFCTGQEPPRSRRPRLLRRPSSRLHAS